MGQISKRRRASFNYPTLVARNAPAFTTAFGQGVVSIPASAPGFSGSEDFSELGAFGIPSAYLIIGRDTPETVRNIRQRGSRRPPIILRSTRQWQIGFPQRDGGSCRDCPGDQRVDAR